MKNGLINRLIGRVGLWLLTLGNKEHEWQECGCWNCIDAAEEMSIYEAQAADKDFQEETAKRMARRRKPASWDNNESSEDNG